MCKEQLVISCFFLNDSGMNYRSAVPIQDTSMFCLLFYSYCTKYRNAERYDNTAIKQHGNAVQCNAVRNKHRVQHCSTSTTAAATGLPPWQLDLCLCKTLNTSSRVRVSVWVHWNSLGLGLGLALACTGTVDHSISR